MVQSSPEGGFILSTTSSLNTTPPFGQPGAPYSGVILNQDIWLNKLNATGDPVFTKASSFDLNGNDIASMNHGLDTNGVSNLSKYAITKKFIEAHPISMIPVDTLTKISILTPLVQVQY